MGAQTKTLAEQVADGIMNLIQETPYKAGDKLPTEKELCESHVLCRARRREENPCWDGEVVGNVLEVDGRLVSAISVIIDRSVLRADDHSRAIESLWTESQHCRI